MSLDEFVKEVLSQIISGIRSAQEVEGGAFVVPAGDGGHDYAKHPRVYSWRSCGSPSGAVSIRTPSPRLCDVGRVWA